MPEPSPHRSKIKLIATDFGISKSTLIVQDKTPGKTKITSAINRSPAFVSSGLSIRKAHRRLALSLEEATDSIFPVREKTSYLIRGTS
jgi:hypothetical protein